LDDFLLQEKNKSLQNKTITLSYYVPLLDKEKLRHNHKNIIYKERQTDSDMRFWMDPRLLRMLTDIIAPKLATMDPQHLEEYLENEIVLRSQLKKVENKMLTLFRQLSAEQKLLIARFNPYLKNRYLSFTNIKSINTVKFQPELFSCINSNTYASIPLNLAYMEQSLNNLLQSLEQCNRHQLLIQ